MQTGTDLEWERGFGYIDILCCLLQPVVKIGSVVGWLTISVRGHEEQYDILFG